MEADAEAGRGGNVIQREGAGDVWWAQLVAEAEKRKCKRWGKRERKKKDFG